MNTKRAPKVRFKGFTDAWELRKWIDTVDISTNMVDPRSDKYDHLPHIGPGNIECFSGRLYDNVNTVKEDNLISGKFHFYKGDIIYGKINPQLGKYVFAPFEGLASADAYVLNAKNELEQTFLFTLLQTRHFFKYSVSVSMRSGMPKINRDELNEYLFMAPNKYEQRRIGELVLSLDHLITLHQRKLDKMKALKKAFLNLIFSQKLRFYGFNDSWERRKLKDVAEFNPKSSLPKTFEYVDLESVVGTDLVNHRTEESATAPSRAQRLAQQGDIFYQTVRPYQKNNYLFKKLCSDYVFSTGYAQMRPHIDNRFLFCILQTDSFVKVVLDNCTGTSYPAINSTDLSNIEVEISAHREEQVQIGNFFCTLDRLITLYQKKIDSSKEMKKILLRNMLI